MVIRLFLALALIGCRGGFVAAGGSGPATEILGRTPGGAVYHAGNCVPDDDQERLVVFSPGTGGSPAGAEQFVEHLGRATGLCIVAVGYENRDLVAACCTTTDTPQGLQDPECLKRVLGAKAAARPPQLHCTDGSELSVPAERSIEGAVLEALTHLDMGHYLDPENEDVRWERIVLTGHSQGAQLSIFIALTRHAVAGVGSIGGGVLPSSGARPYPDFVYDARTTDPALFKAFHHANDEDAARREVYRAIGFSEQNIRVTRDFSPGCKRRPHSCVVVDSLLPTRDGIPVFLEDWRWLVEPRE